VLSVVGINPWLYKCHESCTVYDCHPNKMLELPIECNLSLLSFSKQMLLGNQLKVLRKVVKLLF